MEGRPTKEQLAAQRDALRSRRAILLDGATPDEQDGWRWVWRKFGHLDEPNQKRMMLAFAAGVRSGKRARRKGGSGG